jgi:hypothetical protein
MVVVAALVLVLWCGGATSLYTGTCPVWAALNADGVATVAPSCFAALNATDLAAMVDEVWSAVSAAQLKQVPPSSCVAFAPSATQYLGVACASLSSAQLAAFRPSSVGGFKAACLAAISADAAVSFTAAQVAQLSNFPVTFDECTGIGASITSALTGSAQAGFTAGCAAFLTDPACAGFQSMRGMSLAGVSGLRAPCLAAITAGAAATFSRAQVAKFSFYPSTYSECAGIGPALLSALPEVSRAGLTGSCTAYLVGAACAAIPSMRWVFCFRRVCLSTLNCARCQRVLGGRSVGSHCRLPWSH